MQFQYNVPLVSLLVTPAESITESCCSCTKSAVKCQHTPLLNVYINAFPTNGNFLSMRKSRNTQNDILQGISILTILQT